MASAMTAMSALKKQLRTEMKTLTKTITKDAMLTESNLCSQRLLSSDMYRTSHALSIFLSMPSGEVQTDMIIQHALNANKRVFIPKVTGPASHDMVMVEILSYADIQAFPKSKWGIPEPPLGPDFIDATETGVIDLIVVPGCAFDKRCGRLGHGKGYYGISLYYYFWKCQLLMKFI